MTAMATNRTLALLVLALVPLACGKTRGDDTLAAGTRISLADAIGRATTQVPGGKAVRAELTQAGDRVVYRVHVAHGGRLLELHVDAHDGHIARREEENEDRSREASAPVALAKAVETAAAAGRPVAARIETRSNDVLAIEVDVVSDDKTRGVEVDATTGILAEVKR
jgi:uncharacterized membrane protein YkoI